MRTASMILAGMLVASFVACERGTVLGPASEGSEAQTSSPSRTPEGPDMASKTPLDAGARMMVDMAVEQLASRLDVAVDQIALVDAQPVVWQDAGLGCAKPGVDYIPMPTPGYRISLQVAGTTYEYHADEGSRVILCVSR